MKIISQPAGPLLGRIEIPGDKSISHRAALFGALANGESSFENYLIAGVTNTMLKALKDLGIQWELDEDRLVISGKGTHTWTAPNSSINCQNSATTMRLLAGALAATGTAAVLDGSQGLRRRPMSRIIKPLQMMGAPITASSDGRAPLSLKARPASRPLHGIDYELPIASAQVKTTILLAGLTADSATTIHEPGPSRDHTERMLASMGAKIHSESSTHGFSITIFPLSQRPLSAVRMSIPGDFSSAAFLIVAALITPGSEIKMSNVGLNPTRTGLLDVLRGMGAQIEITNQAEQHGEPVGDLTVRCSQLQGIQVNGATVVRMIDEFPIFAIAASSAEGLTTVRDAIELRHKESDRIAVLCKNLRDLGIEVNELPDGFTIEGGKEISGGRIQAHGDHRMAMAFTVAGLVAASPVSISGAEMIDESFPGFVQSLRTLGAEIYRTE
jgi:3-phosphoshikimate 1-carboxyvinyltransferase